MEENKDITQDQIWIKRITRREKVLREVAEDRKWARYKREYEGDYSELLPSDNIIPLNLIYAYVRTEIPSLYLRDPHFEFTPTKETTIEQAKLKEIAVNDIWRRKKCIREVRKGIQDGKLIGHGWFKVGYQGDAKAIDMKLKNNEFVEGIKDDYFFYRINWKYILFNDEAVDPPYDCTWIAQKFYMPLKDARENGDFDVEKRKLLVGVHLSQGETIKPDSSDLSAYGFGDGLYAELYEIWDNVNRKVYIVSTDNEIGILQERNWPYTEMSGFPFLFLALSPVNDDPYPISDVGMGEPMVLEKTKIRNAWLNHLKRGNRQIVTKIGNLEQEMKDMYEKGVDSALLEAKDPNAFAALPYAQFQNDVYGLETRVDDDLAQAWGQSPNARSGAAKTQTRTKFELERQTTGSVERRSEEVGAVEDLVVEAVEKISSLLDQYATEPFYVSLTGFTPEEVAEAVARRPSALGAGAITNEFGFTLTRDDIKGPVDASVKQGSAIPMTKEDKMKLILDITDRYIQFKQAAQGQPSPFLAAAARMILEEAGLHELTRAFKAESELINKQQQAAAQQQQQAIEQQETQQQLQIGQKAAETQLKAEEIAIKRQGMENDTMIELLNTIKDIQATVSDLRARQSEKDDE